MDFHNTGHFLIGAALFFGGFLALCALRLGSRRSLHVKNSNGVFIAGDHNKNISAQISAEPASAAATPLWRRAAAFLAWLATLAGPVIAALAYWLPNSGG